MAENTRETAKEPTKAEQTKLEKLGEAYRTERKKEPGYSYQLRVVRGQTIVDVQKIGQD